MVQKVQRVQRGRWTGPKGPRFVAACGGGLCRKIRKVLMFDSPFGPRVVVAASRQCIDPFPR